MPPPRQSGAPPAGRRAVLTPGDVAELAAALAAGGGGGPTRRGPPLARGSVKYYLDLDGVDASSRPDAVESAAVAAEALTPDGAIMLAIGNLDPAGLRRARRIYLWLGSDAAIDVVERLRGRLPVPRDGGPDGAGGSSPAWSLPVRATTVAPPEAAELEISGLDALPSGLHREGFPALLLAKLGVVARIIAVFHPTTRTKAGSVIGMGRRVRVWAIPAPGTSLAQVLPHTVVIAGAELRLHVDRDAPSAQQPVGL